MPLFQNDSLNKTFLKKVIKFDLHENEAVVGTHFHMNGFSRRRV